jgi:hypothetical protein
MVSSSKLVVKTIHSIYCKLIWALRNSSLKTKDLAFLTSGFVFVNVGVSRDSRNQMANMS